MTTKVAAFRTMRSRICSTCNQTAAWSADAKAWLHVAPTLYGPVHVPDFARLTGCPAGCSGCDGQNPYADDGRCTHKPGPARLGALFPIGGRR